MIENHRKSMLNYIFLERNAAHRAPQPHLITRRIQMRQQLPIDEIFGIVDDHHHDSLRYEIPGGLGHNAHVRVNQVANGLHLTLELWIHAAGSRGV